MQSNKHTVLAYPLPLYMVCWNYHLPTTGTSRTVMDLASYHIHLAAVDFDQLFTVVSLRAGFSGLWDFIESVPSLSEKSCIIRFNEIKRGLRAELKQDVRSGILVASNGCSPNRITRTIEHVQLNQGIVLYDPARDGFPNN